eukprot:CAMPEP_0114683670 /NCGR_PEP_ID=MMETSP0191-20121206/58105_1 /TAXON_ID=126664 /ORGANISM="Sorites sp." /LENGTH=140 /DNA_ID=CAMNT_0001965175 /DNA_START=249 /DNA_END=671 /DNA_ORIENTATION=+
MGDHSPRARPRCPSGYGVPSGLCETAAVATITFPAKLDSLNWSCSARFGQSGTQFSSLSAASSASPSIGHHLSESRCESLAKGEMPKLGVLSPSFGPMTVHNGISLEYQNANGAFCDRSVSLSGNLTGASAKPMESEGPS